jgi:hypothetical protein
MLHAPEPDIPVRVGFIEGLVKLFTSLVEIDDSFTRKTTPSPGGGVENFLGSFDLLSLTGQVFPPISRKQSHYQSRPSSAYPLPGPGGRGDRRRVGRN